MRFLLLTPAVLALLHSIVVGMASDETDTAIPVINISVWTNPQSDSSDDEGRTAVARQVAQACRDIGFFAIMGHSLPSAVVDEAWIASADFFDLSSVEKLAAKSHDDASYPYGYERSEKLIVGKNKNRNGVPADLKETFSIGPNDVLSSMPSRQWPPTRPPRFEAALTAYFEAMEALADTLLQIFAVGLGLEQFWFRDKMDHHMSALRILNYYSIENVTDLPEGSIRASAHTDYGILTILKSGGPGLQVRKDLDGDSMEQWVDTPQLDEAFIINIGDLMQKWTNDEWVSTLHRVVLAKTAPWDTVVERRQSIAYFVNTNHDAVISPLDRGRPSKYAPVTMRDHLMAKHLAAMGHDNDDAPATTEDNGDPKHSADGSTTEDEL